MTDAYVKLPDDTANTGKDVLTKLVGDKHLQVVVLADDAGDAVSVAAGRLQVDVQHEQPPATEATLQSINTKTPVLGQALAAASVPVVLASNQPVIEVSGVETDGAAPTGGAMLVAGVTSGGTVQYMEVNASGHVNISDGGGSITIDNTHLAAIDAMQTTIGALTQAIADQNAMMMQMLNYLQSLGNVDSGYRQRVVVDGIAAGTITTVGTVTAVTAVTSVTNVAAIGGFGYQQFQAPSQTAYNTGTLPYLVSS